MRLSLSSIRLIIILSLMVMTACKSGYKSGYTGADISDLFSIEIDKETKKTTLTSRSDEEWELFRGTTVEDINYKKSVLTGNGKGVYDVSENDSIRYYYQVATPSGTALISESLLPLEGTFNARDLGGLRTTEGRYVKWGKLFRSDELSKLTGFDLRYLESIGIKTIVDFRSPEEFEVHPDTIPAGSTLHSLPMHPGTITQSSLETANKQFFENIMSELYIALISDSSTVNEYRKFFDLLQNEQNIPLLFHCTAGKDRTGMAAALILFSLGVDYDTIVSDYLLSDKYIAPKFESLKLMYPETAPLLGVEREFLQSGLDYITTTYGSIETYLTEVLGVDIGRMQEIYLYN